MKSCRKKPSLPVRPNTGVTPRARPSPRTRHEALQAIVKMDMLDAVAKDLIVQKEWQSMQQVTIEDVRLLARRWGVSEHSLPPTLLEAAIALASAAPKRHMNSHLVRTLRKFVHMADKMKPGRPTLSPAKKTEEKKTTPKSEEFRLPTFQHSIDIQRLRLEAQQKRVFSAYSPARHPRASSVPAVVGSPTRPRNSPPSAKSPRCLASSAMDSTTERSPGYGGEKSPSQSKAFQSASSESPGAESLNGHVLEVEMRRRCARVLYNLSLNPDQAESIAQEGGIDALCDLLSTRDGEVQRVVSMTFVNLSKTEPTSTLVVKALPLLSWLASQGSLEVRENTCRTVVSLLRNPDNEASVVYDGGLFLLSMQLSPGSERATLLDVATEGVYILSATRENIHKLAHCGVIEAAIALVRSRPHWKVTERCVAIIHRLSCFRPTRGRLQKEGAVSALLSVNAPALRLSFQKEYVLALCNLVLHTCEWRDAKAMLDTFAVFLPTAEAEVAKLIRTSALSVIQHTLQTGHEAIPKVFMEELVDLVSSDAHGTSTQEQAALILAELSRFPERRKELASESTVHALLSANLSKLESITRLVTVCLGNLLHYVTADKLKGDMAHSIITTLFLMCGSQDTMSRRVSAWVLLQLATWKEMAELLNREGILQALKLLILTEDHHGASWDDVEVTSITMLVALLHGDESILWLSGAHFLEQEMRVTRVRNMTMRFQNLLRRSPGSGLALAFGRILKAKVATSEHSPRIDPKVLQKLAKARELAETKRDTEIPNYEAPEEANEHPLTHIQRVVDPRYETAIVFLNHLPLKNATSIEGASWILRRLVQCVKVEVLGALVSDGLLQLLQRCHGNRVTLCAKYHAAVACAILAIRMPCIDNTLGQELVSHLTKFGSCKALVIKEICIQGLGALSKKVTPFSQQLLACRGDELLMVVGVFRSQNEDILSTVASILFTGLSDAPSREALVDKGAPWALAKILEITNRSSTKTICSKGITNLLAYPGLQVRVLESKGLPKLLEEAAVVGGASLEACCQCILEVAKERALLHLLVAEGAGDRLLTLARTSTSDMQEILVEICGWLSSDPMVSVRLHMYIRERTHCLFLPGARPLSGTK